MPALPIVLFSFAHVAIAFSQSAPIASPERHRLSSLQVDGGVARAQLSIPPLRAVDSHLLLARGTEPLAVLTLAAVGQGFVEYAGPAERLQPSDSSATGWFIPSELTRRQLADWPPQADYYARIATVGPGGRTAWLAVGAEDGAQEGDSWWLRIHGQPAARFDTVYVADRLALCRVQRLATDVLIERGGAVALWPRIADRRDGAALTAISYLEQQADRRLAWIALPPNQQLHAGEQVEFSRQGTISGFGVLDRIDDLFGYVRITGEVAPAPALPRSSASPATPSPASQPTLQLAADDQVEVSLSPAESSTGGVRIGDAARVRTAADIRAGRFIPRIVSLSDAGYLINAGEAEQLKRDFVGTIYRDGRVIGAARVLRVHTEYSLVRPVEPGTTFQPADAFGNNIPPAAWSVAGRVERSVGKFGLRIARSGGATLLPGEMFALGAGSPALGVAVILEAEYRHALAFVLPESCDSPIATGVPLIAPPSE